MLTRNTTASSWPSSAPIRNLPSPVGDQAWSTAPASPLKMGKTVEFDAGGASCPVCVCGEGGLASMSWIPSSSLRPCLKRSPLCVPEATRLLGREAWRGSEDLLWFRAFLGKNQTKRG